MDNTHILYFSSNSKTIEARVAAKKVRSNFVSAEQMVDHLANIDQSKKE